MSSWLLHLKKFQFQIQTETIDLCILHLSLHFFLHPILNNLWKTIDSDFLDCHSDRFGLIVQVRLVCISTCNNDRVSCHVPCQLTAAEEAAPDWRAMFRGAVMCEPRAFVPQQNPTSAGVCYSTINWECEWCGIPARALQSLAALAPANTVS